ncbi:hypothetical protein C8R46DRAFT_1076300 [Mycena filopes]|nr:hypothetical protein C8R46DRAFT_1076300 [Mycena filopes]
MAASARKPYSGPRTLLFGIDVGTTSSGLSYSILEPGQVPVIRPITRFPAQPDVGGDSKVPTSIFYSREGIIRSQGAETALAEYKERAEDEGWELARWFKLHLRPEVQHPDIPPLPHRATAVSVLSDFLRYLLDCAKTYIEQSHSDGAALWTLLFPTTRFVMAHPNGWDGKQQTQMRDAAVIAGLMPNSDAGHQRLQFVTEGEASLHFCVQNGLATQALASGEGVIIVDAGGGTIDISTYRQVKNSSGHAAYEEIAPPQCLFNGSIYVTRRAYDYIEDRLGTSEKYKGDIENITEMFDTSAKLTFRGEPVTFVQFGRPGDNDPSLNIRQGRLKIPGADVANFFEPSIRAAIDEIQRQQISAHPTPVSSVFLVGGFAASGYFFSELKARLQAHRLDVTRPDAHVNKAVADGAVSFYIDHHVSVRVAKATYGLEISESYNPNNREHISRRDQCYRAADKKLLVPRRFSTILNRGVQVCESTKFRQDYLRKHTKAAPLDHFSVKLWKYRGRGEPRWMDVDHGLFEVAGTIEADTSTLKKEPQFLWDAEQTAYFQFDFTVVLSFGLTELKAEIEWDEEGVKKRGPARVVYS